jgi:hypothetical protein
MKGGGGRYTGKLDFDAGIAQPDYRQCRHAKWWRKGFDPKGNQRVQCSFCLLRTTDGGKNISDLRVAAIKALMEPGAKVDRLRAEGKISSHMLEKYRVILRGKRPPCLCGKTADHSGQCAGKAKNGYNVVIIK